MKKNLFCLMALLCVMGVSAQSRSMSALVPTDSHISVNVTIDNQSFDLIPEKITIQEETMNTIKVIVYHNHGQANVTLPVSYDFTLEAVKAVWDLAYKFNFISTQEYETGCQTYNRQKITK